MPSDQRGVRVRLAAFYFFSFGGLGGILTFLPLVLETRGLDAWSISAVMLFVPITNLLAPPVWGLIADAFSARVALIRATGIGCACGALVLLPNLGFWGAMSGMAIYCFFRAPIIPLADAATYASLGAAADRYARIRLWGSVGFVVVATTVGRLGGSQSPTMLFGVAASVYVLATLSTIGIDAPPVARQPSVLAKTIAVVRGTRLPWVFLASALYYVAHGAYDVYFGLHMRALDHDDAFVGVAWAVGVTCEVMVMFVVPRFLSGAGSGWFLTAGAAASVARWSLLSYVTSELAILATQSLHALTFGLWYVALVKYVQTRAPDHLRTSVQGLAQASMAGGMIVGYLGGAELYERAGGALVFQVCALFSAAALVTYAIVAVADRRL